MSKLVKFFLLACAVAAGWIPCRMAAQNLGGTIINDVRYLFLVDTSSSMKRYAPTTRNVVYDLIANGMNGQIEEGESFAVWTFNDRTFDKLYPVQRWSRSENRQQASAAVEFLREQKFQRVKEVSQLMNALGPVVLRNELLTLFIVSEGGFRMFGAPFDDAMNAIYQKNDALMKEMERPLVTTLVIYQGRFVGWSIDVGGGAVKIPDFEPPPKPKPAKETTPELTEAPVSNAAQSQPSGNSPKPAANKSTPESETASAAKETNSSQPKRADIAKTDERPNESAPKTPNSSKTTPPIKPAPPLRQSAAVNHSPPRTTNLIVRASDLKPQADGPKIQGISKSNLNPAPEGFPPKTAATKETVAEPTKQQPKKPSPQPALKKEAANQIAPPPPTPMATQTPVNNRRHYLWLAGGTFVAGLFLCGLIWLKSRKPSPPSLITRSFDNTPDA